MNVDDLAQEIRRVDGSNSLGAGALAEALMPFLDSRLAKAERALEEAERVIKPFADVAREISDETGVPEYALSDNRFVSMTLGECRAARKWMEERHD